MLCGPLLFSTTAPAPNGINERLWLVCGAGRTNPSVADPMIERVSLSTCFFSERHTRIPAYWAYGACGRERPAKASESRANCLKEASLCPFGSQVSASCASTHYRLANHQSNGGRNSNPISGP